MSWASEHAQSVFDSLDGAFRGNGIVLAVAAAVGLDRAARRGLAVVIALTGRKPGT